MAEEEIIANSYVGFDTITQQIEHKLLKRGFQFNVIVVGAFSCSNPFTERSIMNRHFAHNFLLYRTNGTGQVDAHQHYLCLALDGFKGSFCCRRACSSDYRNTNCLSWYVLYGTFCTLPAKLSNLNVSTTRSADVARTHGVRLSLCGYASTPTYVFVSIWAKFKHPSFGLQLLLKMASS